MASNYKLTYFDTTGAAEHIRYIFAHANQKYEDVRLKPSEWPFIKPTTPFGKVPVLEIKGQQIAQSNAIARYLARQFGLTGKDEWEALHCDVMVDSLADLLKPVYEMYYETDPKLKEERQKQLEKDIPFYLSKFDKIIVHNPNNVLVGSQITWADLTFAAHLGVLENGNPDFLKSYAALDQLVQKVHNIPGVKAWLDRRPPAPPPASIEF